MRRSRRQLMWLLVSLVALGLVAASCTSDSPDANAAADDQSDQLSLSPFSAEVTLTSPDGRLRIEVGIDDLDRARYRIIREVDGSDEVVLGDSTLGLETSIGSFATATELRPIGDAELVSDSFALPHGKTTTSSIDARVRSLQVRNSESPGELTLDLWASNDGVAFRYRLDAPGETITVNWERTSFAVPAESRAWLQAHDPPTRFTPAYERLRSRETTADTPGRAADGWNFPALFASPSTWTLITETALSDGAAGSHLSPIENDGEYFIDLADRGEGNGVGDPRPMAADRWVSPWRLIVNSEDVGDIVETNLVRHLSPEAQNPGSFDWVQPGRVSWSWWSDHGSSRDAEAIEPFIDLAAELGWEYSLVDANWDTFGRDRLAELAAYAREREVGLFVWYNSGGPNNAVTEAPRDLMTDRSVRQAEFAWLADVGFRGVKVDFFHTDKPVGIQQYRDILSDAADAELMVNFHGSTLPRGWSREFPNLMTMESVRGAETYTFDGGYYRVAPRQNTVLPFTRNVVGAMDYTPVILGNEVRRITTNGHELALAVVFESGLLHLVDTPDAYLRQPTEVVELLMAIPTVWDEAQFVAGAPESHVVIARRRGQQWWIGGISALDEVRVVEVDLADLGLDPGASLTLICDDPAWEGDDYADPGQYRITTGVTETNLRLPLAPNGGCLARLD